MMRAFGTCERLGLDDAYDSRAFGRVSTMEAPATLEALAGPTRRALRSELNMSKMCGDTARFNRIHSRRTVRRAQMRVLRAEMEARKIAAAAVVPKPKV